MSLPYQQRMIARAKELRKQMTPQEKHLWYDFLKDYPVRFQRQKTISSFVADFYCHAARLIVEVDGMQHNTEQGAAYDQDRSSILARYGLTVLRFTNREVETGFCTVCIRIDQEVQARLPAEQNSFRHGCAVPPPSEREA